MCSTPDIDRFSLPISDYVFFFGPVIPLIADNKGLIRMISAGFQCSSSNKPAPRDSVLAATQVTDRGTFCARPLIDSSKAFDSACAT